MSGSRLERRLAATGDRLAAARSEVSVCAEQLEQLRSEVEDARLRALVSETPLAVHDHLEARRHLETLERHQSATLATIAELEQRQDALLDELSAIANRI